MLDPIDPTPTPRLLKKSCDHFMQVKQYLFVTDVPNKADKDKFTEGALWISRPGKQHDSPRLNRFSLPLYICICVAMEDGVPKSRSSRGVSSRLQPRATALHAYSSVCNAMHLRQWPTHLHAHAHTYTPTHIPTHTHTHTHAKGTEPWGIPKWRLADFPSGESAKSQHFTVVDASENEVVAAVLHTQTDIRGIGKMVVSGVPAITQEVNLSRALFSELLPESSAPLELRLVFHKENPLGCPENGTYSWEDDSEVVEPFAIVVRRGTNYTAVPIAPPSILVDSREEIMIGCAATPPPQPSPPLGGCG